MQKMLHFKTTSFFLTFLFISSFSIAMEAPQIVSGTEPGQLVYPKSMKQLLKSKNSRFKPLQLSDFSMDVITHFSNPKVRLEGELPYAAVTDFNLDGKKDLAILGQDGVHMILQMAISKKDSYKLHSVWQGDYNQELLAGSKDGKKKGLIKYLSLIPKDKNQEAFKKLKVEPRPCLQLEVFNGETSVYCFIKGEVKAY